MALFYPTLFDYIAWGSQGELATGGELYAYYSGTNNPAPIYNSDGNEILQPIVVGSDGRVDFRISDAFPYRIKLFDDGGELIFQKDNVQTPAAGPQGATGGQGPTGLKGAQGDRGADGVQGSVGPAGLGVPDGGLIGQYLIKTSIDNYDTQWADGPDLDVYVPYTGATSAVDLGTNNILAGNFTAKAVSSNSENLFVVKDTSDIVRVNIDGNGNVLAPYGKLVSAGVQPTLDSTYTIGENLQRWANVYADNVDAQQRVLIGDPSSASHTDINTGTIDTLALEIRQSVSGAIGKLSASASNFFIDNATSTNGIGLYNDGTIKLRNTNSAYAASTLLAKDASGFLTDGSSILTSALGSYLPLTGGTMLGNISMGGFNITGGNAISGFGSVSATNITATSALYEDDVAISTKYAAIGHLHTDVYEPANANIQSHIASTSNPHSTSIVNLSDTTITSVTNNEVLAYDTTAAKWINKTASEAGLATSSHNHSATNITSGVLAVARGGTNIGSYTVGSMLYASAATVLTQIAPNSTATKQFLSQTSSGLPAWSTLTVSDVSDISSTYLPLAGGTITGNLTVDNNTTLGASSLNTLTVKATPNFNTGLSARNGVITLDIATPGESGAGSDLILGNSSGSFQQRIKLLDGSSLDLNGFAFDVSDNTGSTWSRPFSVTGTGTFNFAGSGTIGASSSNTLTIKAIADATPAKAVGIDGSNKLVSYAIIAPLPLAGGLMSGNISMGGFNITAGNAISGFGSVSATNITASNAVQANTLLATGSNAKVDFIRTGAGTTHTLQQTDIGASGYSLRVTNGSNYVDLAPSVGGGGITTNGNIRTSMGNIYAAGTISEGGTLLSNKYSQMSAWGEVTKITSGQGYNSGSAQSMSISVGSTQMHFLRGVLNHKPDTTVTTICTLPVAQRPSTTRYVFLGINNPGGISVVQCKITTDGVVSRVDGVKSSYTWYFDGVCFSE